MKAYIYFLLYLWSTVAMEASTHDSVELARTLSDPSGVASLIETTNDQNRAARVQKIISLLASSRSEAAHGPDEAVRGALSALANIATSMTPVQIVQAWLNDSSVDSPTRTIALGALGEITRRVEGDQTMIARLKRYLENAEPMVAGRAKAFVASTNTPEALFELDRVLQKEVAALPPPGFAAPQEKVTARDPERWFGFAFQTAEALNRMQLPEAKAKVAEVVAFLRSRYTSGAGLEVVKYFEQELSQP